MEKDEIRRVTLTCKDCGEAWEKKYRKEYRESTKSYWWRPSSFVHYCEVLKKKSESASPPSESINP